MFEKYEDVAFKKLKCIQRIIERNVWSKHISTMFFQLTYTVFRHNYMSHVF